MYKMLGFVILILVAGVLIYMARMGSRRGVIKLLYALVSIVLCMTVSAALTNPVASFLKKETGIYKGIYKSVDAYVKENIEESMQESGGDVVELLNDGTVLPKELAKNIIDTKDAGDVVAKGNEQFCDYLVTAIADFFMNIIVSMCIIIITYMIVHGVCKAFDILSKLPVIHEFNEILGCVMGLVEGIIVLWLMCLLLSFCGTTEYGCIILKSVENNVVLKGIYDVSVSLFLQIF